MALSLLLHLAVWLALAMLAATAPPPEDLPPAVISVALVPGQGGGAPQAPAPAPGAEASRPQPAMAAPAPVSAHPHRPQPRPAAPPRPATEDFDSRLRAQARRLGPVVGAGSGAGARGKGAGYDVKDMVRAQILRRWTFDSAALAGAGWIITLHVILAQDGSIDAVSVIDNPAAKADPAYGALARTARNAVLLAAPLTLPAGLPAAARDMVLSFDPRAALR